MSKPIIALMYDFDHTLSPKDMQEYSFIPSLGMEASEFWSESDRIAKENQMDRILSYMYLMIKLAKKNNVGIKKDDFMKLGANVEFFPGVKGWFKHINDIGEQLGVEVQHFILSSGLKEIVEGTPISKYFTKIYACEFHYNTNGNADWPKQAVNYTTKTQFLFRISKGVLDVLDDERLNTRMSEDERPIPFRNMIYIGDGLTDVPCMTVVKSRGGEAIAIYEKDHKDKVHQLLEEGRVGYICQGNYSLNSNLTTIVTQKIKQIALQDELAREHERQVIDMEEGN
jgi:hypothetical protein